MTIEPVNRVTVPAAPAPAEAPNPVTPPAERPAWLPEKFKTPDDLAKAYAELEQKLGKPATPPAPETPKTPETPAPDAAAAAAAAGLDMAKLSDEYAKNGGKLSPETLADLAKKGIDQKAVDNYVAGQNAIAEKIRNDVFKTVGGEDKYGEMIAWAQQNLSTAEAAAYDDAVNSGDVAKINLAVAGLNQKFVTANGKAPTLVGGTKGSTGPNPFASTAELVRAMSDPRYAKDPAYRAEVENRLKVSSVI